MAKLSEYEKRSLYAFESSIHDGKWTNEGLISMLKLLEVYLNLKRVSDVSKETGKSTQGLRRKNNVVKMCGYSLIIYN